MPPTLTDPTGDGQDYGWRFLQANDLRAADREFSATLERAPTFYPAETGLGYVELAKRDQRSALSHFDRVLQKAPDYAPALVGRGLAQLDQKRDGEALKSFEAALAADPSLVQLKARVEVLRLRAVQQELAAAMRAADGGHYDEAVQAYMRAIANSPQSPFLYRDLALLERKQGRTDQALEHFRRAVALDPTDGRALVHIGDILEERGDLEGAVKALQEAEAQGVEADAGISARIEALNRRIELAKLPPEYRAISESPQVSREELAALIGVKLDRLLQSARKRAAGIITDARSSWAAPWIQTVVRAGIMDVNVNHTFQPHGPVRRGDLAVAVSRLLNVVAAQHPAVAKQWQTPRQKIADLAPSHLSYPAASLAVAAGVLPLLEGNMFQLTRPVSGAEAIAAIDRIESLASGKRVRQARADSPRK